MFTIAVFRAQIAELTGQAESRVSDTDASPIEEILSWIRTAVKWLRRDNHEAKNPRENRPE